MPYRGIRVVTLSVEDVEDLYACRAFLEADGRPLRRDAASPTDEVKELRRAPGAHGSSARSRHELKEYRDLNRRFH